MKYPIIKVEHGQHTVVWRKGRLPVGGVCGCEVEGAPPVVIHHNHGGPLTFVDRCRIAWAVLRGRYAPRFIARVIDT